MGGSLDKAPTGSGGCSGTDQGPKPAKPYAGEMGRPEPVYRAAIALGRGLFGFWRLKRRVTGADNIPSTGGAVIAMTHFGYLEFALVEWVTWLHNRRLIRFMVQKPAFDTRGVGWLLHRMKHIEVNMSDGSAAYDLAVAALRRGELVGIFPEAGVSASFIVRELKTGAARLAAEAGVPIIPVAGWGGHRLLTKNRRIRAGERFGVPVTFAIGQPITVSPASPVSPVSPASAHATRVERDSATTDAARDATARLRASLQSLTDELQASYPVEGTAQWWQPRHLGGAAPTHEEAAAADEERRRRRDASQ